MKVKWVEFQPIPIVSILMRYSMIQGSKLSGVIFALMLVGFIASSAQAGDGLFARLRHKICKAKCPPVPTCVSHCDPKPGCASPCVKKCNEDYQQFVSSCEKLRLKYPCNPEFYENCMSFAADKRCRCINGCNSCGATHTMALEEILCVSPLPGASPADCEAIRLECLRKAALRGAASDQTKDECDECYRLCIEAVVAFP